MKSKVTIETVVTNLPEGGSARSHFEQTNTTGVRVAVETTFGSGVSSATSWTTPPNARHMTIVLPTTNTNPWRLTASTAEVGVALSSHGASVYALPESTSGTQFFAYTTSTRAISGVRIVYT